MKKLQVIIFALLFAPISLLAQEQLTVRKIMQDPKVWVGTSPSGIYWSVDNENVYFDWNPEQNPGDSVYSVDRNGANVRKVGFSEKKSMISANRVYNTDYSKLAYIKNRNIFIHNMDSDQTRQLTQSYSRKSDLEFSGDDARLFFMQDQNLFSIELGNGLMKQWTDFRSGNERGEGALSSQDEWLKKDQEELFEIIQKRNLEDSLEEIVEKAYEPEQPKSIYVGQSRVSGASLSPDQNFIVYSLLDFPDNNGTKVPDFVTESGYTEELNARSKVGSKPSSRELWLYDIKNDSVYQVPAAQLPGIKDKPEYFEDYSELKERDEEERHVYGFWVGWSQSGKGLIVYRSADNKDRWICTLDPVDGSLKTLDRQRDEAWVAGPGIGWGPFGSGDIDWMPDQKSIWFQSEESGYSHLYVLDTDSGKKKALTKGNFEVYDPFISRDKSKWYFTANEEHPGVRHFYSMPLKGGKMTRITSMEGNNDVTISPDEETLAIRYSNANTPWELYLMDNQPGAEAKRITESTTDEFNAYNWRKPDFVTFEARDGAQVHARLYKPENAQPGGPAVVFVHGAGYLQNAHKWWSSYFREYMFHNLLVDNGYTILDIDYRASAGYGRDWRTAIYRHMGGWDLNDQVDGAKYLVEEMGVNEERIGIYGGSYGGFITLMALFTQPDVFACGAALRSVTDWAHYNDPYTSNILNTPELDPEAYKKSSPIYFADGLANPLLICHGMIDTNVHFQDVVRLAQRLIELEKEDWEFAVYPVERHGFQEPKSWADEYTRIFKLFEEHLK